MVSRVNLFYNICVWATSVVSCAVCVWYVCVCVCVLYLDLQLTHISFISWLLIRKTADLRLLHKLLSIERVLNAQTHAQHSLKKQREREKKRIR